MIGTLLRKEFHQHGMWLVIIVALTWLLTALITFSTLANGLSAGVLSGIGTSLSYLLPISVYMICHFLVATEFRSRSRVFLEGLPLSKVALVSVKVAIVFWIAVILSVGAIAVGILIAQGSEVISSRFVGILLSSAFAWTLFLSGFCFLVSMLGRYKFVVLFVVLFVLNMLAGNSAVRMSDFPPFGLMQHFGLERDHWPVREFWITIGMAVAFFGLAYFIALAREGSIEGMLGEKMGYGEKMLMGGACFIFSLIVSPLLEDKGEPFRLPGAVEEQYEGAKVFVSPEDIERPIDEDVDLAGYLAREVAAKRDWMGISAEDFPDVYVVEDTTLEDEMIDWEEVDGERVALMYAGYREAGFSRPKLVAYTMSVALSVHTLGRADQEHRWWIVCGIEGLWEMEHASEGEIKAREKVAFDTAEEYGYTVDTLMNRKWLSDEAGWREADAVAWMTFRYLEERVGMEKIQGLLRAIASRKVTRKDSRPSWREWFMSVPHIFEKETGMTLEELVEGAGPFIRDHPGVEEGGDG